MVNVVYGFFQRDLNVWPSILDSVFLQEEIGRGLGTAGNSGEDDFAANEL